jgi:hypothetical protein
MREGTHYRRRIRNKPRSLRSSGEGVQETDEVLKILLAEESWRDSKSLIALAKRMNSIEIIRGHAGVER